MTWKPIERRVSRIRLTAEFVLLFLGRLFPAFYDLWLRTRPRYQQALAYALESKADVYHASDWATLYVAAEAARKTGALVVIDNDEYWPLFEETSRLWTLFFAPVIRYVLGKYAADVDAAISVSRPIAERYHQEYGYDSILIYNAPEYQTVPQHDLNPERIRLIHHGSALRNRHLETMIEAVPLLDERFTLDLMLAYSEPGYLDELKALAARTAPNRIFFRDVVKISEVVQRISDCDIGLCYMAPTTYTWLMTLPNKLFEFIVAELAVLSGPSPAMADIVQEYHVGWSASGFEAQDLATALNTLTVDQIAAARAHAREAAKILNAETELNKLLELYQRLFDQPFEVNHVD
ncbi:MAG TPA: glycosyltransferase [Phototrophicaceae bacterium]|nr:glycosyltransferase [Phototrophicaceae bacterium]